VSANSASDNAPFSVDTVIRHHHAAVVRYLRRRGASYEDACDLAQEAYMRLLRYEGASDVVSPPAMLFRIAGNIAADHLRAAARQAGRQVELGEDDLESSEPSAERELSAEQHVTAIEGAIAELSPRCRSIFLMSRVDGLTYEQVAVRVGISVKAVEKHVSTALSRLRRASDDGNATLGVGTCTSLEWSANFAKL
jgi:RNA polymerase sigma-70 factor (ECF subfamily)